MMLAYTTSGCKFLMRLRTTSGCWHSSWQVLWKLVTKTGKKIGTTEFLYIRAIRPTCSVVRQTISVLIIWVDIFRQKVTFKFYSFISSICPCARMYMGKHICVYYIRILPRKYYLKNWSLFKGARIQIIQDRISPTFLLFWYCFYVIQ